MISIEEFYKNRDILVTGGLGFIGKVLLEKLLRSCPEVKNIFILIRGKNDKSAINRLESTLKLPLFSGIQSKNPEILKKIIPIVGDVTADNLGMSEENIETLKNVSIIFHSAATVRFDDTFKDCILINTKGTLEILKFAENLKNLVSFVYVSTAYCNLDRKILEEKIYPPYGDWKKVIDYATNSNQNELVKLAGEYSKYCHNNYTLSKHFAEQICEHFKNRIPLAVFRPAIVVPTSSDPFPGWIDNFNGPIGLHIAVGSGLGRCAYFSRESEGEYTTVDVCVKIILLAAYRRTLESDRSNIHVYNCSDTHKSQDILDNAMVNIKKNPFEKTFWVPNCTTTSCLSYFRIMFFLFQFLPAVLLDALLLIFQQRPFLKKLQMRYYNANIMFYKFVNFKWTFAKGNIANLEALIKPEEMEKFSFMHEVEIDLVPYVKSCIDGSKLYLLHEPAESSSKAKQKVKIMYFIDKAMKVLFFYWIICKIYNILN